MKNVWILTEERPKPEVIEMLLRKLADDKKFSIGVKNLKIVPVMKNGLFTFTYRVDGVTSNGFGKIYLKIVSGSSSFVDFLLFLQDSEPTQADKPLYAVEETKTDDSESRNTGVYQRLSKFVYVQFYYPKTRKIMLYSLSVVQKKPSATNVFGMRILETLGVEVLGKTYEGKFESFSSLEELMTAKNAMRLPPKGNVPIQITVHRNRIEISGRLIKNGSIGHDPNIGALTGMSGAIRLLSEKPIVITKHGLSQEAVKNARGKFTQIAQKVGIRLEGVTLPVVTAHEAYWHYEHSSEKLATILLHVLLDTFTKTKVIYSNHGGTERSYFARSDGTVVAVEKYQKGGRTAYKEGDKTMIIHIPDLIVYDKARKEIINIEGKKYENREQGIVELGNFTYLERNLIRRSYPGCRIIRTVALYGSKEHSIRKRQISFVLNEAGEIIVSETAPLIFKEGVRALLRSENK